MLTGTFRSTAAGTLAERPGWLLEFADRILCGKRVDPITGRVPFVPFLISICLIAISNDFFEIVLPSPVVSGDAFPSFLVDASRTCEGL